MNILNGKKQSPCHACLMADALQNIGVCTDENIWGMTVCDVCGTRRPARGGNDPKPFGYRVSAESSEQLTAARDVALARANPEFLDPNDLWLEQLTVFSRAKRVGDYFDSIEVSEITNGESFGIVFTVRHGANRYWKDVAANLLKTVAVAGGNVLVERVQ